LPPLDILETLQTIISTPIVHPVPQSAGSCDHMEPTFYTWLW